MGALVIAHRGASALEPENSLAAFRAAVRLGANGVELDVHATTDGHLVVVHDPRVGGRPIAGLALAEVKAHPLSNGEPIPTLPEALAELGAEVLVFVEVKTLTPVHDAALLAVLDAAPVPARCHVHAFDHRIVRRLKDRRPTLVTGVLSSSYPVKPFEQVHQARASELWQHEPMIDARLVVEARGAGLKVYAWTVDDPDRMKELARFHVDGICTNRPDLAREVLG